MNEEIRHIISQLRGTDIDAKKTALIRLGEIGGEEVIEDVEDLLYEGDPGLKYFARKALEKIKQRIYSDEKVVLESVSEYSEKPTDLENAIFDSNDFDEILDKLDSDEISVRSSAVNALGEYYDEDLLETLLEMFGREEEATVKICILNVLIKYPIEFIEESLLEGLRDPNSAVKITSINGLEKNPQISYLERMLPFVTEENNSLKENIIKYVYSLPSNQVISYLDGILKSPHPFSMKQTALIVLNELDTEEKNIPIKEASEDADEQVRTLALKFLSSGSRDAIVRPVMESMVFSFFGDDPGMKEVAIKSIETIKQNIQNSEDPDHSNYMRSFMILLEIFQEKKKIIQVIEMLEILIQVYPGELVYSMDLFSWLMKSGDQEKALSVLIDFLRNNPRNIVAVIKLANYFYEQKDYVRSGTWYTKAIDIEPDNSVCLYRLGMSWYYAEDYEESVEYLLEVAQLRNEDSLRAHWHAILCYIHMKEVNRAEELIRRTNFSDEFFQEDENLMEFFYTLGSLFYETGFAENANEYLQRVIEIQKDYRDTQKILELSQRSQNSPIDSSIDHYNNSYEEQTINSDESQTPVRENLFPTPDIPETKDIPEITEPSEIQDLPKLPEIRSSQNNTPDIDSDCTVFMSEDEVDFSLNYLSSYVSVLERNPRFEGLKLVQKNNCWQTYSAQDNKIKKSVIVRVPAPEVGGEAALFVEYNNILKKIIGLSHPGIFNIYDFEIQNDFPVIIYEAFPGKTVERLLTLAPKFPPKIARGIVLEYLKMLVFSHKTNILIGAASEDTVVVAKSGKIKVDEFGLLISQARNFLIPSQIICPKAYYLSPESRKNNEFTELSDIYSVGVLTYRLFTGELPFGELNPYGMEYDSNPYIPLSQKIPGINPGVDMIVSKCLSYDPDERYPDAQRLLFDWMKLKIVEGKGK